MRIFSSHAGLRRSLWASLALLALANCDCGTPVGEDGGQVGAVDDGGGLVLGDGGSSGADGGVVEVPGLVSLSITPDVVDVVLEDPPQELTFTVTGTLSTGATLDLTDRATYTLHNTRLGAATAGVLTPSGAAGVTTLVAAADALTAEATLTLRQNAQFVDEGTDPTGPNGEPLDELLQNAPVEADFAPELYYPNDGVLLPPNLGAVEVHFQRRDTELYMVRFFTDLFEARVFTGCDRHNGGCIYTPTDEVWAMLANTARGGQLQLEVTALDEDGSRKGTSSSISLQLAAVDVEGAMYYWTTTRRAIMRVDFGSLDGEPEQFWPEGDGTQGPCYGCHALSPDGFRMSLSQGGQWQGQMTLLDVRTQGVLVNAGDGIREQFQAWNPTSTQFAAIYGDDNPADTHVRIRDGNDGSLLEEIDVGSEVSHPHWSPTDDRIVFTVVTHHYSSQRPGRGGLSYIEKVNGAWTGPHVLIAPEDGKNHYTPVYAPDGSFIVFNESVCSGNDTYNDGCDADADNVARMYALSNDGSVRTELANANASGVLDDDNDLANTYPRWAPFTDALAFDDDGSPEGRVMWMTFSSRRRYGLRDPGGKQLLWMVGVDPAAVANGQDGSFKAFALPFQDLTTSNHMAQWAQNFVEVDPDAGVYVPPDEDAGQGMCIPAGEACLLGDECCDGYCTASTEGMGVCREGSCVPPGEVCQPASGGCCNGGLCLNLGEGVGLCQE